MKRKTLKFFACAAIMAMTLSVTACGGSDKDDPCKYSDTDSDCDDVHIRNCQQGFCAGLYCGNTPCIPFLLQA